MPLKGDYNFQNIARKKLKEGKSFSVNARWEIPADTEQGLAITTNGGTLELVSIVAYTEAEDCLIYIIEGPDSYDELANELNLTDNNRKTKNDSVFDAKLAENITNGINLGPNFYLDVEQTVSGRTIIGGYTAAVKPLILDSETIYIIAFGNQSVDNPTMVNIAVELFE